MSTTSSFPFKFEEKNDAKSFFGMGYSGSYTVDGSTEQVLAVHPNLAPN